MTRLRGYTVNKLMLVKLSLISIVLFSMTLPAMSLPAFAANEKPLMQTQVDALLAEVDERSKFESDFKAVIYLQQKHREKGELLYQASVYRRDENDRFMMLFLKPKSDAGKGYLVMDKNLFLYSPNTGDWSRVSEDRIAGTDTNLNNFETWNLVERFNGTFVANEKLGKFKVHHIALESKPGKKVDNPKMDLWIEMNSHHVLKQQDFALSGKLLRTTYRTKWKLLSDEKSVERYIPIETRIYNEVEKGNQTIIVIDKIALRALPANIFSKAWLESKSR
ncbi:MAG: outer membrane lipoprotein-sorting protein [Pseudomonadales bacterium]|nr:outer membrane lipoprotein-sorting protein [Pseudomonadales bacterium]